VVVTVLMASTLVAYPQVVSRSFASFDVLKFKVSAGHADFCAGFDSRQLPQKDAGQGNKPWPVFFYHQRLIKLSIPLTPAAQAGLGVARHSC
jgi:hypothetical protein